VNKIYPRPPRPPPLRDPELLEPPLRELLLLTELLGREDLFTELLGLEDRFTELLGLDDLFTELLGRELRTEDLELRFTLLLGLVFRTEFRFLTLLFRLVALLDLRPISDLE
jgi:hypothetical protein